ncbi:hypothetical protein DFJ73DRAFT_864725 [Zopfochytrium polystomum]|nr:hypothetical protein DFJ73DRAFT_864725 [Zopfochytrium polystomum]
MAQRSSPQQQFNNVSKPTSSPRSIPPTPTRVSPSAIPIEEEDEDAKQFKNDLIFKIRSIDAYLAPADCPDHLSFRKGQAFYALAYIPERKCFFVSTQYATPFSRTSVNGFVPRKYFEVVDLNSPEPATKKASKSSKSTKPAGAAASTSTSSSTSAPKPSENLQTQITPVKAQSVGPTSNATPAKQSQLQTRSQSENSIGWQPQNQQGRPYIPVNPSPAPYGRLVEAPSDSEATLKVSSSFPSNSDMQGKQSLDLLRSRSRDVLWSFKKSSDRSTPLPDSHAQLPRSSHNRGTQQEYSDPTSQRLVQPQQPVEKERTGWRWGFGKNKSSSRATSPHQDSIAAAQDAYQAQQQASNRSRSLSNPSQIPFPPAHPPLPKSPMPRSGAASKQSGTSAPAPERLLASWDNSDRMSVSSFAPPTSASSHWRKKTHHDHLDQQGRADSMDSTARDRNQGSMDRRKSFVRILTALRSQDKEKTNPHAAEGSNPATYGFLNIPTLGRRGRGPRTPGPKTPGGGARTPVPSIHDERGTPRTPKTPFPFFRNPFSAKTPAAPTTAAPSAYPYYDPKNPTSAYPLTAHSAHVQALTHHQMVQGYLSGTPSTMMAPQNVNGARAPVNSAVFIPAQPYNVNAPQQSQQSHQYQSGGQTFFGPGGPSHSRNVTPGSSPRAPSRGSIRELPSPRTLNTFGLSDGAGGVMSGGISSSGLQPSSMNVTAFSPGYIPQNIHPYHQQVQQQQQQQQQYHFSPQMYPQQLPGPSPFAQPLPQGTGGILPTALHPAMAAPGAGTFPSPQISNPDSGDEANFSSSSSTNPKGIRKISSLSGLPRPGSALLPTPLPPQPPQLPQLPPFSNSPLEGALDFSPNPAGNHNINSSPSLQKQNLVPYAYGAGGNAMMSPMYGAASSPSVNVGALRGAMGGMGINDVGNDGSMSFRSTSLNWEAAGTPKKR